MASDLPSTSAVDLGSPTAACSANIRTALHRTSNSWADKVAAVVSLVVQHCPAASEDPRHLCSLLQVSTACRAALLEHVTGHCCPGPTCSADGVSSFAAWLPKHIHLVQDVSLEVVAVSNSSDDQLATALRQVCKLRCLDLVGGRLLPGTVVQSIAAFTGLTALDVNRMRSVDVPCLPYSLIKAVLRVEVADPSCDKDTSWRLHVSKPSRLECLDISVLGRYHLLGHNARATKGVVLQLPGQKLRSLAVSGAVSSIAFAAWQAPSVLSNLKVAGTMLNVSDVARLMHDMPQLQHLHINVDKMPGGPCQHVHGPFIMRQSAAAELAAAVGAATKLTSLFIGIYSVQPDADNDLIGTKWGEQLCRLKGLRRLSFGLEVRAPDLPHFAQLTALTSLQLRSAGMRFRNDSFEGLCVALPQLQELTVSDSGIQHTWDVFAAVAGLTSLCALSFDFNRILNWPGDTVLDQLLPLQHLTHLVLPSVVTEKCSRRSLRHFMVAMPRLRSFQVGNQVFM